MTNVTNKVALSDNSRVNGAEYSGTFTDKIITFDNKWTKKLAICADKHSTHGLLRQLMKFLELSCHGVPWIMGTIVAILMTHQIATHQRLLNLLLVLLLDVAVVATLKVIVRRQRPAHNYADMPVTAILVDRFSFPSGHATRAATVTYFLVIHVISNMIWMYALVVWAVLVTLSRVVLGRHHILDVLCGVVIGVVQYKLATTHLWLPADLCEKIIRPFQEELHL